MRSGKTDRAVAAIDEVAASVWETEFDDPGASPPLIELTATGAKAESGLDSYVFAREVVAPSSASRRTGKGQARTEVVEAKLKAIAQILAAYGMLDTLSRGRQESLLRAIYRILSASEE